MAEIMNDTISRDFPEVHLECGDRLVFMKEIPYRCKHQQRGFRKVFYVSSNNKMAHVKTEYICTICKSKMSSG